MPRAMIIYYMNVIYVCWHHNSVLWVPKFSTNISDISPRQYLVYTKLSCAFSTQFSARLHAFKIACVWTHMHVASGRQIHLIRLHCILHTHDFMRYLDTSYSCGPRNQHCKRIFTLVSLRHFPNDHHSSNNPISLKTNKLKWFHLPGSCLCSESYYLLIAADSFCQTLIINLYFLGLSR